VAEKVDGLLVAQISKAAIRKLMWTSYGQVPPLLAYLERIELRFINGPPEAGATASASEPCPAWA
jgi:hypothetical protein